MRYIALLVIMGYTHDRLCAYGSLQEIQKHGRALPEHIQPENNSDFFPNYTSLYKKLAGNWFKQLLQRWHLIDFPELFDADEFKRELRLIIREQRLQGYDGKYVAMVPAKADAKFIVWGDLQGAYHSLVRYLEELRRQNILADDLSIVPADVTLVFNANGIGRTPYNLSLLNVMVSLMLKNPGRVFYVKGPYESKVEWDKSSLLNRLMTMGEADMHDKSSLAYLISEFFDTLPHALYINYNNGRDLIRFSAHDMHSKELNESLMNDFFLETDPVNVYYLQNRIPSKIPHNVRLLFRSIDGVTQAVRPPGAVFLGYEDRVAAWSVFSSPTSIHQKLNKFYHDAFAVVTLGKRIEQTTITLYSRDVRSIYPEMQAQRYLAFSGVEIGLNEPVKISQPITIGSTFDLSRGVQNISLSTKLGIDIAFKECNKNGGIHGRYVELFVLDDEYDPHKARKNIETLMRENNVDIFLCPIGSDTMNAVMDMIRENKLLIAFPIAGDMESRQQSDRGIIHMRCSNTDRVYAMILYMVHVYAVKKFAFFYQNDGFGKSLMIPAREILKSAGIEHWTELPYQRNTTDFNFVTEELKKNQPEALGLFSLDDATKELWRQMGIEVFSVKMFAGNLIDATMNYGRNYLGIDAMFAISTPNPTTSDLPIVQEYRRAMDAHGALYEVTSLESYMAARLLIHAMQEIKGPLNHITVMQFFESLKDYHFKGLTLTFRPATRELSKDVWLDTGKPEWIKISDPEMVYTLVQKENK